MPTQLVDLGIPFAARRAGPVPRPRPGSRDPDDARLGRSRNPGRDPPRALDTQRLGQLGRATEALSSSLDAQRRWSVPHAGQPLLRRPCRERLGRAAQPRARGRPVRARPRRPARPRSSPAGFLSRPAATRASRTRSAGVSAAACSSGSVHSLGVFPTGAPLPLPPLTDLRRRPRRSAGLALLGCAFAIGWLVARGRLAPATPPTAGERLTGLAVALGARSASSPSSLAVTKPYALVFVLPSLYAWLWLPLERRALAPSVAVRPRSRRARRQRSSSSRHELGVSIAAAAVYTSSGSRPSATSRSARSLLLLVWAAAAAQVGALAFGRYAPYAGGAEPPPARARCGRAAQRPPLRRGVGSAPDPPARISPSPRGT